MAPARYSRVAIALHWAIALALAGQVAMGLRLEHIPRGPELFWFYQLHKSIGITILLLSLARLGVRLVRGRPPGEPDSPLLARLASLVHAGFYLVMIGGPLTGWLLVSTSRIRVPTLLFHILPWPHLPVHEGARRAVHEIAETAHGALAWIGIGLFLLHVAGAVRHQLLLGEPLIERMLPGRGRFRSLWTATAAFAGLIALVLAAAGVGGLLQAPRQTALAASARMAAIPATAPPSPAAPAAEPTPSAATDEPPPAEVPAWTVSPGGALGFTARWTGQPIEGSFARWRANIRFAPEALDRSSIRVTVDLASASTGDGQRDQMLTGDEFLAAAAHPTAIFTADKIRSRGGDRYEARGTLELRGAKRPATLAFTLNIAGSRATVSGDARIDRTAFGVGIGEWAATDQIAAEVAIRFAFTAVRREEGARR